MAAIVTINEWNGSSGSQSSTDKTSGTIRFKKADNATVDALNPLKKPTAGNDRSFEKWLRLRIGATGPTGAITNLQFYTNGNLGTGATVYARTTNPTVYATPAIPGSDTTGTNATTYVTGSRKSAGAGPYSGTSTDIGDFIVLWLTIDNSIAGPQNPTPSMTLTFSYDET